MILTYFKLKLINFISLNPNFFTNKLLLFKKIIFGWIFFISSFSSLILLINFELKKLLEYFSWLKNKFFITNFFLK